MTRADDRALLGRAQTSATGFSELFDAYYDRIYAYAYRRVGARVSAEDIAAAVFEDALRGIRRVRWRGKPLVAWLYRIAARRVADHYRARKHDAAPVAPIRLADDPGEAVERAEEFAAVRRALARLNARDREIIVLTYFDELDGATLAALLGCTPNSVYVRTHRALKKLEAFLKDEVGDE